MISSPHPSIEQPNFYTSMGGKSGAEWVNCCFVNQWGIFGIHLSCRNGSASCIDGQLAGPAWGHVKMAPATLDWFLRCTWGVREQGLPRLGAW